VHPSVAIIILNWNNARDTLDCLGSLQEVQYPSFEIFVIDNGSTDGSAETIREAYPEITLIANPSNLGFAVGNNQGIQLALEKELEYILLLNNDTVVDPGMLNALVEASINHADGAAFSAKTYYHSEPNRIWLGMPLWNKKTCRFQYDGFDATDDGQSYNDVREVSYACGCAMLLRSDAVRQVGLLDPRFFCYYEEIDWCFRARKHGFASYYVPDAKVWHKVSASSGGKHLPIVQYFRTRNGLLWSAKYLPLGQRLRVWRNTFSDLLREISRPDDWRPRHVPRVLWFLLMLKREPNGRARLHGIRDYCLRRFGDAPSFVKTLNAEFKAANEHA